MTEPVSTMAYLIVYLDVTRTPAVAKRYRILNDAYCEDFALGEEFPVEVTSVEGDSPEDARGQMRKLLETDPNIAWVGKLSSEERKYAPTAEEIVLQVADAYHVPVAEVLSKSGGTRTQSVTLARRTAVYLIKILTRYSWPELGRMFGNRDHTTMLAIAKNVHKNKRWEDRPDPVALRMMDYYGVAPGTPAVDGSRSG